MSKHNLVLGTRKYGLSCPHCESDNIAFAGEVSVQPYDPESTPEFEAGFGGEEDVRSSWRCLDCKQGFVEYTP